MGNSVGSNAERRERERRLFKEEGRRSFHEPENERPIPGSIAMASHYKVTRGF